MQELANQMKDMEVIAPMITLNAAITAANKEALYNLAQLVKV